SAARRPFPGTGTPARAAGCRPRSPLPFRVCAGPARTPPSGVRRTVCREATVNSYSGDDMEDFFTTVAADGGKWLEATAKMYSDAPDRLDAAITDTAGRLPDADSVGQ